MHTIPYAPIYWQDQTPGHRDYQDHYFSRHDGLRESRYIFLACNDLPQRWRAGATFVIAETGFGSGLNFLATLDLWRRHGPAGARLHYLSLDRFLVHPDDFRAIHGRWPALQGLADELLQAWPEPVRGLHRREFLDGACVLTLGLGEVTEVLSQFDGQVDAWFLDGFAPSRNPEMWTPEVFAHLARLSRPGASASSFTVAGVVRRGLAQAGFEVRKVPGYADKREMLRARYLGNGGPPDPAPWFQPPPPRPAGTVVVVGAGIAGVTAAAELAARGHETVLVDQGPGPASGASGNPAGVVLPRLSAGMSPDGQFYLAAFLYTLWRLQQLQQADPDLPWHPDGVIQQLAQSRRQGLLDLGLPPSVLREHEQGLFYPGAGWLQPEAICRRLLQPATPPPGSLACRWDWPLQAMTQQGQRWRLDSPAGTLLADTVVLATGWQLATHPLLPEAGLRPVRGQLSLVTGTGLPARPVCGEHYVTPAGPGSWCTGASWDPDCTDLDQRPQQHQQNLEALASLCQLDPRGLRLTGGRTGIRAAVLDHLPLVGPVADPAFYRRHYQDLRHGRPAGNYPPGAALPGLLVSAGHGSRGLCSAFLSAAMLADYIDGTPLPVTGPVRQALHPGRFLVRGLRRGTLIQ